MLANSSNSPNAINISNSPNASLDKQDISTGRLRVDASLRIDEPVSVLKSVTPTKARALEKLGIKTIRDLIYYAPFRYMDFTNITPIAACQIGDKANVLGTVDQISTRMVRPKMRVTQASIVDNSGIIMAVWFNQPWISNTLCEGTTVLLQGTVDFRGGFKQFKSPEYIVLESNTSALEIRPIYRQTKGITSAWILRFVREAFDYLCSPIDPLPVWLRLRHNIMSRHCALQIIHRPINIQDVNEARRRLAYEELLLLQLHWAQVRSAKDNESPGFSHEIDGQKLNQFLDNLPFELTQDQKNALQDVLEDMNKDTKMSRMLLGDVGTGKTMIAAGALVSVCDSGTQGVMMAPTEVLAKQYGRKIGELFDQCAIRWATLTSSTTSAERKNIVAGLASGQIDVLFSTHAALEDDIKFSNLTLVVIDEQHRFGVDQRKKLKSKGQGADYLCMTATPIPRSLALTMYGNMDCSYIRQRPGKNRDIETIVMDKANRFAAFDEIRQCVSAGRQAYIICPLIGETKNNAPNTDSDSKDEHKNEASQGQTQDDLADLEHYRPLEEADFVDRGEDLKAARKEAEYLQNQVFSTYKVGLLCGEQSAAEKSEVMSRFLDGSIDILVSTTVVEVGVDVPNATLIVIEDAERFGLSQLHQLRGRVGRGEYPGKAILLASTKTDISKKRMKYIESTQDGFELAKMDLSLRKEGDVVGSRQHGLPALRFSNVVRDSDLVELSRKDAQMLLEKDPQLTHPANALLCHEVDAIYS